MSPYYDVIVIGSGISGLSYALHLIKLNKTLRVLILTKSCKDETATKYAQGGIAVVLEKNPEAYAKHIEDTLIAGDGLCEPTIVEMVVKEGTTRFTDLLTWGVNFDKTTNGSFDLHLEGGHTSHRIAHQRDHTGQAIEDALLCTLKQYEKQIHLLDYYFVLDIEKNGEKNAEEYSIKTLNTKNNQVSVFKSKILTLCTGGIGQVYQHTSNPSIATGDGIAMAHQLKAAMHHLAFIQFHPTTYLDHTSRRRFLITEAIRGKGGKLLNDKGEYFMLKYDARGELASRDIVSRAIVHEIKEGKNVFLDVRHIGTSVKHHFPSVYNYFKKINIDISQEIIPIVPAVHYLCGGIDVNKWGQSTNVKTLFAIGECSHTGLHGANRLASNSLLEAVVFAYRSAYKTAELLANNTPFNVSKDVSNNLSNTTKTKNNTVPLPKLTEEQIKEIKSLTAEVREIMDKYANIIRETKNMTYALSLLTNIQANANQYTSTYYPNPLAYELRNIVTVGILILKDSLAQKQNRGTFYNTNFEQSKERA